ncbi:uncharacterized protein B0J16DRAFT_394707 [Fusarium flagelliforme]|uniref:uncharacterized protein n=1 Tax=Fusarium flagelliforme TaxID=2675880 RepID=UPI001E8DB727|nr:uncharacterized protein B0J16DRAFT_394707 [Fusarium flagelliforme]KAH7192735.1 hypothetical protein B0J16DRAFT_394707 [Fusarium flagelliforme]
MSLHNYGISREDRAEVAVARKGWDDFFKRIEIENQYQYVPGSSSIKISSSVPPSLSNSDSSTPESDMARSEGKRKSSAFESRIAQSERKAKRAKRADTPISSCNEEERASENFDDPTKFCPERCLFCVRIFKTFDQNLNHMKYGHRFIIPVEGGLSPRAMPPVALIHYLHLKKNNDPPALLEALCGLKRESTSERFSHALNRALDRREQGDFIEEYRRMFQTGSKILHHREAIINDPVLGNRYFSGKGI